MAVFKDGSETVVGKITQLSSDSASIEVYTGSVNGVWKPAVLANGSPYSVRTLGSTIIEDMIFSLTKSNRIPLFVKEKMRMALQ